jgi:tRNA pseudouridine38-40 synthase
VRYFLKLSFLGKNYHGWQIQLNAHSVQAELESALRVLLKTPVSSTGCGRTDTGVNAAMFFAHFDSTDSIDDTESFIHQLNCILPDDIAVHNLLNVADNAHARYDATARTYAYHVYHDKNPFLKERAYFFPYELNVEMMNQMCAVLLEYSDFSSFSKSRTQVKTNLCKITEAKWNRIEDELVFQITADRFLRNMVRAIVGTMLEIGESRLDEKGFRAVIEGKNRSDAGVSVPAHGLYLVDVRYPYF